MNITVMSYQDYADFGIIACERSVAHVADIGLGFGAAVADLFAIALRERSRTSTMGGFGEMLDPASACAMEE